MKKLRVGELVYLKNVGFPFNRTDNGNESWEGASCRVINPTAGVGGQYVEVETLIPIKTERATMSVCLFDPTYVIRENRPWLRKHLKEILGLKKKLLDVATFADTLR